MKKVLLCAVLAILVLSCKKESNDKPQEQSFVYEAIDLGLSVKWSNANLGATSPEGYGDYYAWGEKQPKEDYFWSTYKWCNSDLNLPTACDKLNKYCPSDKIKVWDGSGSPDGKTVLDLDDDAARVQLGGKWRMPTASEVDELISTRNNSSYQWEWKSLNGHNGWLVTYLVNNNSIFLPAAGARNLGGLYLVGTYGHFWSSSLRTDNPNYAWRVIFNSDDVSRHDNFRFMGFSVRPVSE